MNPDVENDELVIEGAERRPLRSRYPHILQAVFETPWEILPATFRAIVEVVELRVSGARLSADDVTERIGSGAASRQPQRAGATAVIPIYGVIMPRATLFSQISGGCSLTTFAAQLQQAVDDPQVGAILLDIDSPGGSTALVTETANLVRAANAKKPVTAVANTLAASAAYHIASQAGELYVTPSGYVGSIGVYATHEDLSGMEEMLGVKTTLISAGKYKVEGNEHEPLSDEAYAAIQSMVDDCYSTFVADVAKGRNVSVADVRDGFGEGRVVTAKAAVQQGMADGVATFDAVLSKIVRGKTGTGSQATRLTPAPDEETPAPLLEAAAIAPVAEAQIDLPPSADEGLVDEVDETQGPDSPARAELDTAALALLAQPGFRQAYRSLHTKEEA